MPSLGGGGRYGGDDPSGGASRDNGGYGDGGWNDEYKNILKEHRYNLMDPSLYSDIESARAVYARNVARQNAARDFRARQQTEQTMAQDIAERSMPWSERVAANNALKRGDLSTLDKMGFDTLGMRETHHSGGLLGNIFGTKEDDDVRTISEARKELMDKGFAAVDPATGQIVGARSPLGPGFAMTHFAPATGQFVGEQVYGLTDDAGLAQYAGVTAAQNLKAAGEEKQESAFQGVLGNAAKMGLNMIGGAPVNAIGQMIGGVNTAYDMQYAGLFGNQEMGARPLLGESEQVVRTPTTASSPTYSGSPVYGSLYQQRRLG